jgi:pilus assembly protein CpaC
MTTLSRRGGCFTFGPAVLLFLMPSLVLAQQAGPLAQKPAETAPSPTSGTDMAINLTAGRSTVLATDFDITRIAVTNPAIADALVVQPREILIDGKSPGTVSLIVWGAARRAQYDVVVAPAVSLLQQRLRELFPGEDIQVTTNDEAIVLSGHVSSTAVMLKAAEIAQSTAAKSKVINMLQLPTGMESQQVMLQVRFAEVNRKALTELGASFFTGANGSGDWLGRAATQQFAAPTFQGSATTFSDLLNIFLFNTKANVGVVIRALQQKGYFQSLAEPNLIAYNGEEASFLAGGEFPVPVVQGGVTNAVTIEWKEFGVRLTFKPTIAGDTIRLKVTPEVSTLDFNNGITLAGFRVPALTTRRASTDVELRDGQSFAIAGLMDNISQDVKQGIPGLSALPIIGYLFKSKSTQAEQTELMVLITPRLVKPLSPDEVPGLPGDPKRFLPHGGDVGKELDGAAGAVEPPKAKPPAPPKKDSNGSR